MATRSYQDDIVLLAVCIVVFILAISFCAREVPSAGASVKGCPDCRAWKARGDRAMKVAKRWQFRYLRLARSLGPSLGRFELTSYRDGTRRPGSVATDTSVIPRGSWIVAQGMGLFQANDVGGAVNGRHLDVYRPEGDNAGNADYRLPGRPKVWIWRGKVPPGFWQAKWTRENPHTMARLPAAMKYPPAGRW